MKRLINTYRTTIIRMMTLFGMMAAVTHTDVSREMNLLLVEPTWFQFRSAIGLSPKIDPRLKIYFFDDHASRNLQQDSLSNQDWSDIILSFAKAKPRKIIINTSFYTNEETSGWRSLGDQLAAIQPAVPIIISSYVKNSQGSLRGNIEPHHKAFRIGGVDLDPTWDLPEIYEAIFSGPPALLDSVAGIGHSNFSSTTTIQPYFRTGKDTYIPYIALHAADSIAIGEDESLIINETKASLTHGSQLPVNFTSMKSLHQSSYSLYKTLLRGRAGKPAGSDLEGSTILIFDKMTSGHTNFVRTPAGTYPSAYLVGMTVNSILLKNFLKKYIYETHFLLLTVISGSLLGLFLRPLHFWLAMAFGFLAITFGSLMAFAVWGYGVPWFWISLGYTIAGIMEFTSKLKSQKESIGQRLAVTETEQRILVSTLELATPFTQLRNALKDIPEIDIANYYQPVEASGGDWFWVHADQASQRLYLFIGDATGHGVQSSLFNLAVSGAIKASLAYQGYIQPRMPITHELQNLIHAVDGTVKDMCFLTGKVMTMSFIVIDLDSGVTEYANCGHTPIIWLGEKQNRSLLVKGWPLGMNEKKVQPAIKKFAMQPGDCLIMYTDGLIENTSPMGKTLAHHHLKRALSGKMSADEIKAELLQLGNRVWRGHRPDDDCSFIVAKYLGRAQRPAKNNQKNVRA